jgi:lipoate synthase
MPDITMCSNAICPKREICYRYVCIPDQWQSYMEFHNICTRENNFKWFYNIDGRPIKQIEKDDVN